MDASEVTPKQALLTFLQIIIHKNSNEELLKNLATLRLLDEDFATYYILNGDFTSFTLTEEVMKNPDYWLFYLEPADGMPHRIEMVNKNNNWQLKSFVFLCMGCFADYDYEDCTICGGSGWGVL